MKIVKMLVVSGVIATMGAYAQDGGKQAPKKEESKTKAAPAQEMTVKEKSSNAKTQPSAPSGKHVCKPGCKEHATESHKHEEKKANAPK